METEKLIKIQASLNGLLKSGKIDKELAGILMEHLKATESMSIKINTLVQEVAHLVNKTHYFTDAIQVLQEELSQ